MSGTSKYACRDLVQVAQRFEKKNAQDTKAGILYHCLICRKKSYKKIPEYDKWFNKDQTAHNREDQTYPQNFSASVKLPDLLSNQYIDSYR